MGTLFFFVFLSVFSVFPICFHLPSLFFFLKFFLCGGSIASYFLFMSKIVDQSFPFFCHRSYVLEKIALCHARESYIFFGILVIVSTRRVAVPLNFMSISSNGNESCFVG